ncbi:MAG: hypothetical protein AB8H86_10835 [Polyangiales bacterium]
MTQSSAFVDIASRIAEPLIEQQPDGLTLTLPLDAERPGAAFAATLTKPSILRDALATMGVIHAQDLRRSASDRSDYLSFLLKQGKKATKELWEAQKRFLEEKYAEAEDDEGGLAPVLTVDERGLAIEVFSADESAYARLHISPDAYEASEVSAGTSHVPLGPGVMDALGRIRSYRPTTLKFAPLEGGEASTRKVPYRWARAFAQVQAASTLPAATFELAPIDLYNVLLSLRTQKAKTSPRALRYELVPGEPPRLVLEPWDLVLQGHGSVYEGERPQVVRTWGRRRLQALAGLLPHAKSVRVSLVGAGLPAYYTVDLGDATLTLALSGWTEAGWAGITTFDALVAESGDDVLTQRVLQTLRAAPSTIEALTAATERSTDDIRQALLTLIQRGTVLHDVATTRFVARPLFAEPLDEARLRFRDAGEEEAHRLLALEGAVRVTKVHDLAGEGVRIEGEVEDARAHRVYKTAFTIDREGRTREPSCTSAQFRRSRMKEGPSVPMLALRIQYVRNRAALEEARNTPEGRRLITAETRTLVRRERDGSTTLRISLDEKRVIVRRGRGVEFDRVQQLIFTSPDDARDEYFRRLARGATQGFIDASDAEN